MTEHIAPDDRISAYLDGALSAAEHYEVQQLLVASPEWRKELDEVSWARVTVRAMPAKVAPPGFFDDLLRDGPAERESLRETTDEPRRVRGRRAREARASAVEASPPPPIPMADALDQLAADSLELTELLGRGGDLGRSSEHAAAAPPAPPPAAPPPPPPAPPPAAPPPPPPAPVEADPVEAEPAARPVSFQPHTETPAGLPAIPQPTPDEPLIPDTPLDWDRPPGPPTPAPTASPATPPAAAPAGPPARPTRREIVAGKEAALTPPPIRRTTGDDATPLWGKPAPRRRPLKETAAQEIEEQAQVAVEAQPAPADEVAPVADVAPAIQGAPAVEPPPFEPIPIEEARSARSRRALRWTAGAAAAAAVVVAAVVMPSRGSVAPPVPEFAGAHSVRSSVSDDPVMQLATVGAATPFGR